MPPQTRGRTSRLTAAERAELRRRDAQTEAILAQLAQDSRGRPMPSPTTPAPDAYQGDLTDVLLGGRAAAIRAPPWSEGAWGVVERLGENLVGLPSAALSALQIHPSQFLDRRRERGESTRRWQDQTAGLSRAEISAGIDAGTIDTPTLGGNDPIVEAMLTGPVGGTRRAAAGVMGEMPGLRGPASAWKGQPSAPYVRTPEGALVVSTRVPTAKRPIAETGPPGPLVTGLEEVMRNPVGTAKKPSLAEKMANIVRPSPVLTEREAARGTSDVLERFVDSADENLRYLMKLMAPYAERSSKWYQGAHRITKEIASTWGMTADQGTGIVSVLSPQKQWDMNVKLGQRVSEHAATFADADQVFTPEMYRQHVLIRRKSVAASIAENLKKGKITASQGKRAMAKENATLRAQQSLVGRPWSELAFPDRAYMVRAHDELVNPQTFDLYTPEGDVYDIARNIGRKGEPGEPSALSWNSNAELTKAMGIASDPSPENISYWLGAKHKVRSFFNNISAPEYGRRPGERGSSTIDTHEVAAGHMAPLGGKSGYVLSSMGAPEEAATGIRGTNPLYQTAVDRSVRGTPYLPREGQSITWEGIQSVFSPAQKTNKALQTEVDRIWSEYRGGRLSKDQTLDAVLNAAGGFQPPGWAGTRAP